MRELDRMLASIMRNQAKALILHNKVKPILTPNDTEKILGKPKFSNEIYKTANMPGLEDFAFRIDCKIRPGIAPI